MTSFEGLIWICVDKRCFTDWAEGWLGDNLITDQPEASRLLFWLLIIDESRD